MGSPYVNLSRTPTLRGLKRCSTQGCEEFMGARAKVCKKCKEADTDAGDEKFDNAPIKGIITELQNCLGNSGQKYFSVRNKDDSKQGSSLGIVILEQDVYHSSSLPVYKAYCYMQCCLSLNDNGLKNCEHGHLCCRSNSLSSKCLAINWEYVLKKVPFIPEAVRSNLETIKNLVVGFNFVSQPVQRIDSYLFAVFGPKSSAEPHGVAHFQFDLDEKEYLCSCVSFIESGTSNSYKEFSGQARVCYHTYLVLAAFLSDYSYRERHKVTSQFCHLFLQETVPQSIRESSNYWSNTRSHTIDKWSSGAVTQINDHSVQVHVDLFICNLIHLMRDALRPLLSSTVEETSITSQIPCEVFAKIEPRIAGKFGDEWKPIPAKCTVEHETSKITKKEWNILVSKSFNYFMSITDPSIKRKISSKMNLEKFFMKDQKDGFVEVCKSKIESVIGESFHTTANNQSQNSSNSELKAAWTNEANQKYTASSVHHGDSENALACQSVALKKVKPSFISSQVVVGRHPRTSQPLPCALEWRETSPGFGALTIKFFYAKKVNGWFV